MLSYAVVAGVEWCVLTDGDAYRFYNAVAALDADEKLFCKLRLSDGYDEEAARTLSLISRRNLQENLLDVLCERTLRRPPGEGGVARHDRVG